MGECKEAGSKQEEQERVNSFVDCVFPNFPVPGVLHSLANYLFPPQVRLISKYLFCTSLCLHPTSCCWTPSPSGLQGMGQWFPGECELQIIGEAAQMSMLIRCGLPFASPLSLIANSNGNISSVFFVVVFVVLLHPLPVKTLYLLTEASLIEV